MSFLLTWLLLAFAVWVTAALLPGIHVRNFSSAILVAAILGILNLLLGWLFFAVFTVLTLGLAWLFAFLTRWVINALLLLLTAALTDRFKVDGFGWALLGALLISIIGTTGQYLLLGPVR